MPLNLNALALSVLLAAHTAAVHGADINVVGHPLDEPVLQTQIDRIAEKLNKTIQLTTIPEPYIENVEYELIYNPDVDIIDILTPSMERFHAANWLSDLSQFPEIRAASARQYRFLDSAKYRDGKLIGLARSTVLAGLPVIELQPYNALGLTRSDFPQDWPAFYRQIDEIAEQGHRNFFYPSWMKHAAGLPFSFLTETWNRGGRIISPEGTDAVSSDPQGAAYQTLVDWRRAWQSGAIPAQVLEYDMDEFLAHYFSTAYAISVQSSWILLQASTFAPGQKHSLSLLPRVSQNWGTAISSIQTLVQHRSEIARKSPDRKLLEAFMELSLGLGEDEFSYSAASLKTLGLIPVYKDYMDSEQARQIMRDKLAFDSDEAVLMDILEHTPAHAALWHQQWHEELNDYLHKELTHYLLDDNIGPDSVINGIKAEISRLKQLYGY